MKLCFFSFLSFLLVRWRYLCRIGLVLGVLASSGAFALELAYELDLQLQESDLALSSEAQVQMTVDASDLQAGSCLYIPLHDPLLAKAIASQALRKPVIQDEAARRQGALSWGPDVALRELRPAVYEITQLPVDGNFKLAYSLALSGWKDRSTGLRIVTQFYPQLLTHCPKPDEEPYFFPQRSAHFRVKLSVPQGWTVMAPGVRVADRWTYEGLSFSLVLSTKGQLEALPSGDGQLLILSHSQHFERIKRFAQKAVDLYSRLTGFRAERDLMLVETDDFEPLRAPGLIVLNRPPQAAMQFLQEDYSNWSIWQLAQVMAEQWFGLAIRPASLDDLWLTQGFADFLVSQFVASERELANLFARQDEDEAYLRLEYFRVQDLLASLLSVLAPHNALIDAQLKSLPIDREKLPYLFIRHALALRYVKWYLQEPVFGAWLQRLSRSFQQESMSPERVLQSLATAVPNERRRVVDDVRNYWQSDVWPDLAVGAVEATSSGSRVAIRQRSPLRLAFDVSVKSRDGIRLNTEMNVNDEQGWLELPWPPSAVQSVEIDPLRAIYDSDRFNNKNKWPGLSVFPGDARTLADDAYTLIWLPYATKLPGQELTLQLGLQLMRYIDSGLSGLVRYEPDTRVLGFRLAYRKNIPAYGLNLGLGIADNDGRSVAGERLWDAYIEKDPLFHFGTNWIGSSRQRLRQMLGAPERNHVTSAFKVSSHTDHNSTCFWDAEAEHEWSSWVPSHDFTYTRSFGLLRTACESPYLQVRARGFLGASQRRGQVPEGALFLAQNLEEARIRLDRPKLEAVGRLRSFNLDVSTPARLPLPASALVLPRRSLFKVFADWGISREPVHDVQVMGIGYSLPFGGDVAGKSAVTFLQFSLYSVLYRRIDGEIDRRPGFLFDFSGDL